MNKCDQVKKFYDTKMKPLILTIALLLSTPATAEDVDCGNLLDEIRLHQVSAQHYRRLMEDDFTEDGQVYAQSDLHKERLEAEVKAKADLKASAKAKLIAGEPLTADEADTLVL